MTSHNVSQPLNLKERKELPRAQERTCALSTTAATMHAQRHEIFWTRVFFFGASCVAGLIIARKRKLRRFHLHILTTKTNDFGRYFGMDIGGTLAKLVYFQPASGEIVKHLHKPQHEEGCLSHIEAYVLSLHASDHARTAQREERLTLHVPALGGTIHFCKYVRVVGAHCDRSID